MAEIQQPFQTGFMADDDRKKLREAFLNQPAEKHTGKWDELWQQNTTPWDRNGPSQALRDAIVDNKQIFGSPLADQSQQSRKRAFVPGCGRGYDVLLLASLGYDAYGLDASPTAIDAAKRQQAEAADGEIYAPADMSIGRGNVKFLLNDFFKNDFEAETQGGNFDVIFDYTFLCALPPELRPSWAKRMSELLADDGHLICLEWPLGKDPKEGGPPHGLSSPLYEELFRHPGQEVQYHDDSGLVAPATSSEKSENALERVAHFMPSRTHDAGKGKDYVSIWGRVRKA